MGKIVQLNESNFEEVVGGGKVLVDFWAAWCGPCRMLSPVVDEVAEETDFTVAKFNVDEGQTIAVKYNVNVIPTLIVFENGREAKRSVGVIPKAKILDLLK